MIETRYETRVEVQQAPVVNLMMNPTAEVSTASVTTINLTDLIRHTGDFVNMNSRTGTGFRLVGNAAQSNSLMIVGGDAGALRLGMKVGVQYTVSGNFHIPAALAGTAHANARRIVVLYRIGAGAYVELASPQAPNAAGNTRLSLTFTLPAGTTEAFIRWYHGHASATSAYWHSLLLNEGTNTTYFDGGTSDSSAFSASEYGWDNAAGLSPSYKVDRALNVTLPDAEITILSYDNQRVPWIEATIVAPLPSDGIIAMLDPRRSRDVILNFASEHYTRGAGGELDHLESIVPMGYSQGTAGKLWLRTRRIDRVNRTITLTAKSGEARTEDKKRLSDTPLDTGAVDTVALFKYALTDVGEIAAYYVFTGSAVAAIPAGDRRRWMQGESASVLFESELAALEARAYCTDVGLFRVDTFSQPPTWQLLGTRLDDGDDGTLIAFDDTTTREGDWRDATLVKAQYVDGAGVQQTAWQRDNDGVNRKGEVTQISRAIPAATYAASITTRADRRAGRTIRVTAQLDFNHRVGRELELHIQGTVLTIFPERVTYRPAEGEMDIEGNLA